MASIRDSAVTLFSATTTNMVCEMPVHETGDLLLACVSKDGTGAFTTPAGWTLIQASASLGAYGGMYAKRATSSSETVTFVLPVDTCLAVILAIKNVFGSTVADAVVNSAGDTSNDALVPFVGIGLTTTQANALLIHCRVQDTTIGTSHLPPWVNIFGGDVANGGLAVAYSFEPTASTVVAAPELWGANNDDGRGYMCEIRDGSSGGDIPAYIPLDVVPSVLISPLVGTTGSAIERGDWISAASITITSVSGKTVAGVSIATTADSGYNPFRGSARNSGASSTTQLNALEFNLSSVQDVTGGDLIFGTYLHLAPRDYVDTGIVSAGGKYFLAGSDSTNWRAWVVGGQFSKTDTPNARVNWLVQPSYSTSEYDSLGTPNFASLDIMQFGSSGFYGAPAILWNELWELRTAILAGGSPSSPFNLDALVLAVNGGCGNLPLMQQSGSAVTVWIPLQIGGNEPIGIAINLRTIQWPRQADPSLGFVDFHVSNNKLGIEFYGLGSGDLIHFTNCVFTSDSSYYWRFNASHNASTDIDFSGSTVVGANVTLRSTVSLDNVTFINTTAFAQNNAALNSCTFNNVLILSDNPADISNSEFISGGTGHAIEITTPGTYTFTGNTFTGYGADGTTDAAVYNNSGGAVTLNISGGVVAPTVRNGVGASTTVNNNVDLIFEDIVSGSRLYVELDSGGPGVAGTVVYNSTVAVNPFTLAYNFVSNQPIIYRIRKASGAAPYYKAVEGSGTITASGFAVTIQQIEDQ